MPASHTFKIIQGGMGVGVSCWRLARTVSQAGQLGVVSGTGLAALLARRLQAGDVGGDLRRALAAFPIRAMGERVLEKYFVEGGLADMEASKPTPMPQIHDGRALEELTVLGNFVEVFLAKEGHDGVVGINYLEKIQFPTLASLYGAMLARADYVLMGAGIPRTIPGIMDALARGDAAEMRIDVQDAGPEDVYNDRFDPAEFLDEPPPLLPRPRFLAIVSSSLLAMTLARKSNGRVDGFVVESPIAGGHNAPPRVKGAFNTRGEPVYGPRDDVDFEKIRELGLPFYLAGGFASPEQLAAALRLGAAGIQVGTAFAFCEESGLAPELRERVLARRGQVEVFTDANASPTGFPFKVVQLEGTLSEAAIYAERTRICDAGYMRRAYMRPDKSIGYRCPAEPVEHYVAKGGTAEEAAGRKCLCNGLFAAIGFGQITAGGREPAIVTAGDDLACIGRILKPGEAVYHATDVLDYLLGPAG